MLHEAFRLHELKQKLPYKIESIATSGNNFFLGTNDGKLIVYEVSTDGSCDTQCVYIHTSKRKQPIRMIVPIVEKEILLALAGDIIVLHHLPHFSRTHLDDLPEDRLPELGVVRGAKDVVGLHLKRQRGTFSMAVLQRRRIAVYDYHDGPRSFELVRDGLAAPDGARAVLWAGRRLLLAGRRGYALLDPAAPGTMGAGGGLPVPLSSSFSSSSMAAPRLLSLDPVPEVLLGDVRALHDGSPVPGTAAIHAPPPPASATYVHPFLLTASDATGIEVHIPFLNTQTEATASTLCQSINIKNVDRLSQRPFADFDARLPSRETQPDALGKDITIAVSTTSSTVYLLEEVPIREQITGLASMKYFETGLLLSQLCINEVDQLTVNSLKTQFALWSFTVKRDFEAAMLRFRDADVDPRLVINLFPGFLTQRERETWQPPKEYTKSLDTTELAPHMQEAVTAFLDYAIPMRREIVTSEKNALLLLEAIDTAILKAYVVTGQEQQLLHFLSEGNTCSLTEAEVFLADSEEWVALVALWYRYKQHNRVLGLLYLLGTTGEQVSLESNILLSPPQENLYFDSKILHVLEQVLSSSLIGGNSNSDFTSQNVFLKLLTNILVNVEKSEKLFFLRRCVGVVTTIRYVQMLSWSEKDIVVLIKQYTPWILANLPPHWSVTMFPPSIIQVQYHTTVLQILSTDMSKIGCVGSQERVVEWLSLLFGDACNTCKDAVMHNAYWENLAQLLLTDSTVLEQEGKVKQDEKEQKREEEQKILWRRRLDDFLRVSRYTDVVKAKLFFEQPDVKKHAYTECAIIYQRLKLHEEAIRMFLYEAKQLKEAQDYATQVSRDGEDAFCVLLRLLLDPGDTQAPPLLEDAIAIINSCEGADPLTVLPMFPDNTPIDAIADFMQHSLRDASTRSHNAAIYANILEARIHQAERTLARERSRRAVMDLGTCCAVCDKKLRPGIVFMLFPNGVIVHQACMEDEHICPVTHEDFLRDIEPTVRAAF
ncbi:Vacuolar sorting protein 39/Transforming growth factor beta receptor-associated domain 2 [Trypanosoma melophagium]|uniref:Vacuolar sorting protein 39/Transforming growth factor beta receptor-associated domain 2 n=1 Tax=Trypanosoma melophagium TaxID=715481 RepID=UPI003519DDDB|nr:Vacuolar sorting protein 39/Transforming growth factor beta receptor-associated domain 2 [Trypanosoma melophagium]